MGFFSDLREDLSQAVNELLPAGEHTMSGKEKETEKSTVWAAADTKERAAEKIPEKPTFSLEEMLENIDNVKLDEEDLAVAEDSLVREPEPDEGAGLTAEDAAAAKFISDYFSSEDLRFTEQDEVISEEQQEVEWPEEETVSEEQPEAEWSEEEQVSEEQPEAEWPEEEQISEEYHEAEWPEEALQEGELTDFAGRHNARGSIVRRRSNGEFLGRKSFERRNGKECSN